jgi:hypothetical protein
MPLVGLVLLLFTVLGSFAAAQAEDYKKLPWHLMDYRYEFTQPLPFQSLAITIDIKADPDPREFFYLCALWGYIGEESFYLGLQSDVHQGLGQKGYSGPGLIFTRWGTGNPADTRPPADGWVVPPGPHPPDEGLSISVRRSLPWDDGRYTFVLQRRPGTGLPLSSWIDLLVYDHNTGQWIDGGGLRFSTANPTLSRRPVTFAELYGRDSGRFPTDRAQAQGFDPITLVIHPLMVDGTAMPPLGHAVQPKGVPGTITEQQKRLVEGMGVTITITPDR